MKWSREIILFEALRIFVFLPFIEFKTIIWWYSQTRFFALYKFKKTNRFCFYILIFCHKARKYVSKDVELFIKSPKINFHILINVCTSSNPTSQQSLLYFYIYLICVSCVTHLAFSALNLALQEICQLQQETK